MLIYLDEGERGRAGAGKITEYGGRSAVSCEDRAKVQIGAELLCKGGKVRG